MILADDREMRHQKEPSRPPTSAASYGQAAWLSMQTTGCGQAKLPELTV
jgi:hypothetical protein